MIRGGSLVLILMAALLSGEAALAQALRMRTQPPVTLKENKSPWSGSIMYSIVTDYADTFSPRGYTNVLIGNVGYQLSEMWSVSFEGGARAEFFDGQIEKGTEQSYDETFSPTTSLSVDMEGKYGEALAHSYSMGLHGEPLWDEASRLEGYKGMVGAGGSFVNTFFGKRFVIKNTLDITELMNTFYYNAEGSPNPDYFITYKLSPQIKIFSTWKIGYTFGFKTTRYLDGFWGYNYQNAFTLSKTFGNLAVALSYENGGFTDDGTVRLWYIDEYRRIAGLKMNYTF